MELSAEHPPSPPATFVAPYGVLEQATIALEQQGGVVVLTGPPGSGKSATAAKLVDQLASHFEGEPLWINCEARSGQRLATADLAATLLRTLGHETHSPLTDSETIDRLKNVLKRSHRLVVLDGVDDEGQIRDLIPAPGWGSSLIIASRSDLGQVGIPQVDLGPLAATEGVRLLRETADNPAELEDLALCESLVEIVGGLPLAIRMIGSQVAAGASPQDLLRVLRNESARLSLVDSESSPSSLWSALATSYESLAPQGEALFRLLGLLTADSFTLADLERELDFPSSPSEGLAELSRAGLLETDGRRYRLHPLIRRFAREQLGNEGLHSGAAQLAQTHLQESMLERFRREAGRPKSKRGSLSDHVEAQEYALRVATDAGDKRAEAQALSNLGALYGNEGYSEDAAAALRAASVAAEEAGDRHATAEINLALGRIEHEQGRTKSAEAHFRQSVEAFEANEDLEGQGRALVYLGDLLAKLGQLERAGNAYEQALESSPSGEAGALSLSRLARLAELDDNVPRAQELYESALQLMASVDDGGERAALLRRSASLRLRGGDTQGAMDQLEESFQLYRRAGTYHGVVATALTISSLWLMVDRIDDAESWLVEVRSPLERLGDPRLTAIAAFASFLVAERREELDKARALLEEAMSHFRETGDRFGESHSLLALGKLLERSGEQEEAATVTKLGEELLEEEMGRRELSPNEALLHMVLP